MGKYKNPFLEENFTQGSGVLGVVTQAYVGKNHFDNTCLVLRWIEDGREDERGEEYTMGSLQATEDGLGWHRNGEPVGLPTNTIAADQVRRLTAGGFDVNKLFDDETGKIDVSPLVGGIFEIVFEQKKDKDGNLKTWTGDDGKERKDYRRFLGAFNGFKEGVKPVKKAPEVSVDDARALVADLIAKAGGTIIRPDLIQAINADERGSKSVISLLIKKEFNEGAPWTVDGATYSLSA